MNTWTVKLLGEFQLKDSSNVTKNLASTEATKLLAYLLYFHQRSHPCVQLAETLWPHLTLSERRKAFQAALNSLKEPFSTAKEPVIVCHDNKLKLNIRHFNVDILEIKTLIHQARNSDDPQQQLIYLQQAIQRDYGTLLSRFEDDWIIAERRHLHSVYLAVLHQLIKSCLQLKKLSAATAYAQLAVNIEPYNERTHLDLIKVYMARGYQSSAQHQYAELQRIFNEDLRQPISQTATELIQKLGLHPATATLVQSCSDGK
ncbi:transcriptional activator family protein, AfsR-like [Leptolyngbya sp. PCC 7375]|nr:transcriptional activator family protein, AfsR-like [Leptolyngbya sp. PCC 7375]